MTNSAILIKTPEQCGILPYKISAKASRPDWRTHKNCVLTISLGHEYHEGIKLETLVDWAASRFENVIVNLADTLHRHNLYGECDHDDAALLRAQRLGDEWLARNNEGMMRQAGSKLTLFRWAQWLGRDTCAGMLHALRDYYESTPEFRAAVEKDTNRFMMRQKDLTVADHVRRKSCDYLLEEAAVYTIVAREYGAVRAYPASDLDTLRYLSTAPCLPAAIAGLDLACQVQVGFYRRPSSWLPETPANQSAA